MAEQTITGSQGGPWAGGLRDVVSLRLPAAGAYLSVLRTATASLASRLDFTIDDIEDLRIAVDEACAMLLSQAVAGSDLDCTFELAAGTIDIAVSVFTLDGRVPARDTFAWTVLTALAGEVDSTVDSDRRVTITLRKHREDAEAPGQENTPQGGDSKDGAPRDGAPRDGAVPRNAVPRDAVEVPTP